MTTMTPTMTRTISDQDLLALERSYWDALKERDVRTVGRLTAEQCTVAGARGVSITDPRTIAKQLETPTYTMKDYRIDPQTVQVNWICGDTVALAYGIHEDLEVDGKPVKLDAFDSSVWQKSENGWVCVLHTESIKGDSFGRDRLQGHSPS